jgi:SAM-dependent methyltransferase
MDFGPSAVDYAAYRRSFPASFFERLPLRGRILDLGSGTGGVASGYAARGNPVVALELSPAMLRQAPAALDRVVARAEAPPFADRTFDAVVAGQCWHWFDGPRVARECVRLLRPGGVVAIAHFDYRVEPGGVAAATEEVVLRHNPTWPMAGSRSDGRYDAWRPHLAAAGLVDLDSWWYDEPMTYDHASWRGRMRACNGVLAVVDPAERAVVDREIGEMLTARFPDEPLVVPHRVFVLRATRP